MLIPCPCPARPDGQPRHEQDTVELRPSLGFRDVAAIKNALGVMYIEDPDAGIADVLAVLSERYVLAGVESWSLEHDIDGKPEPMPVTKANIRQYLLADFETAEAVADAADALYAEAVTSPLLRAASTSSPAGSMAPSTSQTTGSPDDSTSETPEESNPKPSSPSSITTIRTVGTATTSSAPDGDSRSSPTSESVA